MNKIIAIGDIHGCKVQLLEILDKIKPYSDHELVFLGDYIDRGPDSDDVCKILMDMNAIFLKGNHEEMLINRINHNVEQKEKFLDSIKLSNLSLKWLEDKLQNIYITDDYIFVHAGLDINKGIDSQTEFDYLWMRWNSDYYAITKKLVIHGHTVINNPEIVGNRININTGCGSGGYLTALVLPEMEYLKSSNSVGSEFNWEIIKKELEDEIEELEEIE